MVHVLDNEENVSLTKNEDSDSSIEVVKQVKEKKPRSEKQIEAFRKTQENRKKNIELKKENNKIEAAKLLMKQKPKVKKEIIDSESDEEVIIVEKRRKSKPKRIIVEESDSEEEEEIKPKEKNFKTQQNKRSIIKVNNQPTVSPTTCFFV